MIGYINWDPDPKILIIPFINKPLVWYGVLFALGFFLAYLIFGKLVREFFCLNPSFSKKDFSSFERLLISLKNNKNHPFVKEFFDSLSSSLKQKILSWNLVKEKEESFENQLIQNFNEFLEKPPKEPFEINDVRLKKIFYKFRTYQGKSVFSKLKKRLKFEELFPEALKPIYVRSKIIVEKIVTYTLVATILGARLGHVLFYEDIIDYLSHPLDIFKTWEGGLASHGGVLAICFAFLIFRLRYKKLIYPLSMIKILDYSVIAASFTAVFIRIGNFINQEVLGTVSTLPWAVVFGHPLDGSLSLPRHPAQLYEAGFYLVLFTILFCLRNRNFFKKDGKIAAAFFTFGFTFRFFIEFLKEEQSLYSFDFLNMGQILSLPVIGFGIYLFLRDGRKGKKLKKQWV